MKFVNIGVLTKVNVNNMNSGEGYGNITTLKKVQDHHGKKYVYVSGQAVRRYLKETMTNFGLKVTPTNEDGEPDLKLKTKNPNEALKTIIKENEDLDLFGFMQAKGVRRWSVFKTTPLVSVYPYVDNEDLLTRNKGNKTETGKESERNMSLVKTELNAFNYMRGNFMIDYDRIGLFEDELTWEKESVIKSSERHERYLKLIKGIRYLYGGAKAARLLDELTPVFFVGAVLKAGTPIYLNSIEISDGKVNTQKIVETLNDFKDIVEAVFIGFRSGEFKNEADLKNLKLTGIKLRIGTIGEAFDALETHKLEE